MTVRPDLEAERAALLREQATLRQLCMKEWPIMTQQVARQRNDRLLAIQARLATIERTIRRRAARG